MASRNVPSWSELRRQCGKYEPSGDSSTLSSSRSRERFFGADPKAVRVVLYRDHHAWCPYCQKVWLYLEARRIPYRVRKVTMFCYGTKEKWYKDIVPSGMLPALELDGRIITESDDIVAALEMEFGVLGSSLRDPLVLSLRKLERQLFSSWCRWLCYPNNAANEQKAKEGFEAQLKAVDAALGQREGPFFLTEFSVADVVFVCDLLTIYHFSYLFCDRFPKRKLFN